MPRERTAYEILGLSRNATNSQLKGRYREFARRAQPDAAVDTLLQEPNFRHVARSYVLLMSPARKEYDQQLRQSRGAEVPLPDALGTLSRADLLLLAAETALLRRQYSQALQYGKEATALQSREARGWVLLGDIMKEQKRWDEAVTMYNYAIQMDPGNTRYWQLLNEATALKSGQRPPRAQEEAVEENPPARVWVSLLLVFGFIELSLFWVQQHPGIELFFGMPSRLLLVGVLDGILLGLVLAGNDLLGRFEDELVYHMVPWVGVGFVPLGVFAALPGLVCFWVAVVFYALVAYLDAYLSYSLVAVMACSALILGALAALEVAPLLPLMMLGGNFVFGGMLVGWLLGSTRLFPWRRGD